MARDGGGARKWDLQALDPEIRAFIAASELDYPADAARRPVAEQRGFYDAMCDRFRAPRPAGLTVVDDVVPGAAGPIAIRRYRPDARERGAPRVVYFHGGGFFLGGLDSHDDVCAELAAGAGLELVSVDYRLAPEHPFPEPYLDALAATEHLRRSDPATPIILAGDSVGGGLAAGMTLATRRSAGARVQGAVLIYPSLAPGMQTLPAYADNADAPLFTAADAVRAVQTYAGRGDPAALAADPRFAPLAAEDVRGVARTIALAAEVDPLRDDALAWVSKLSEAGVPAAASVHAGLPHGCLRARHRSVKASLFFEAIVAALRRLRKI